MTESKQIVIDGYNAIAESYHERRKSRPLDWWDWVHPQLPQSGSVLDAGSGGGIPASKYFADRGYDVHGFDISDEMVKLAHVAVPNASFEQGDFTTIELPADRYDLVICSFALFHIPRTEHALVLRKFYDTLRPGGKLLVSMGVEDKETEIKDDFYGSRMYWSMFDEATNCRLVREAGFTIGWSEVFQTVSGEGHLWILAQKP